MKVIHCNQCGLPTDPHFPFTSGGRQILCRGCARLWMAYYLAEHGVKGRQLKAELKQFDRAYPVKGAA